MGFAEMFDASEATLDRLEPGQKVEAEIVRITKDWAFLDLGGKSEGSLALSELVDDKGEVSVKEGDKIEVYFLSVERNERIFTTKIGGSAAKAHLEEAYRSRIPVDGTVTKEIKGGFEVKIGGSVRAFCPFSQMSLHKVSDTEQFIGQQYPFQIIEFKENGRNIILSHRKILEEQRAEQKEALKETLEVGQIIPGEITSIREFGAFVDVGGIEGLIPISEISWGRTTDIHGVLEQGQKVEVAVKKLDWDKDRYSFSLRDTQSDPWNSCTLQEGTVMTGTVARLVDFGAFVTLEPGIDGLIHISNLGGGRRINHPREVVLEGEAVEVRIDNIDTDQKRISLSVPQIEAKKQGKKKKKKEPEDTMQQEYQRFKAGGGSKESSMGTLGDLLKKKLK
ncbi:MAG: 30S ribosomal protein S1 [Desulfobulbaceae bacterium]|nr:30S ribosomal protein S1 [Desulfobulbaceae bacterium]